MIVRTDTGNAYPITSLSLGSLGGPDTESNGMRDDESVGDCSRFEEEMQTDEQSVMEETVSSREPVILRHCDETEIPSLTTREENKICLPPLCCVDVRVGDVPVDACIDSGATFTLLSEKIFLKVHHLFGEVMPADDVNLRGTNGNWIKLYGHCMIQFWIEVCDMIIQC